MKREFHVRFCEKLAGRFRRLTHRVPQRRKYRNVFLSNFTKDEGRPFEIGFQEQVSNHLKQLPLRVVVVSVEEKSKLNSAGDG